MDILKNKRMILTFLLIISVVAGVQAVDTKNKREIPPQVVHIVDESSVGSSISLNVEFKNYQESNPEFLIFQVFINTHSEDLSVYDDLGSYLAVKVDEVPVKPEIIFEKRGGGHHISNILKVKNNYQGERLMDGGTKDIKLVFKNIGEVEERVHSFKF